MRDSYFDLPSRIEDAFAEIDSDIVMDLLNTPRFPTVWTS